MQVPDAHLAEASVRRANLSDEREAASERHRLPTAVI